MRMSVRLVAVIAVVASSATLVAQPVPPAPSFRFASRWPESAPTSKGIIGSVIDIRQVPVAGAQLQLRDLSTGTVVQTAVSNENGEYVFPDTDPGMYVVEMVIPGGVVRGLSNAGSLANNEILQTVIVLPGRWDSALRDVVIPTDVASYLGVSAATSITAETLTLATTEDVPTANAGEPVSSNSLQP